MLPDDGADRLRHTRRNCRTADNRRGRGRTSGDDRRGAREPRAELREDGSRDTRAGGLDAMALRDALLRTRLRTDFLHHRRENCTADLTRAGALLLPSVTGPHALAGAGMDLADHLRHARLDEAAARRAHHAAFRLALVEAAIDDTWGLLRHASARREGKAALRRFSVAGASGGSGPGGDGEQDKSSGGEKEFHGCGGWRVWVEISCWCRGGWMDFLVGGLVALRFYSLQSERHRVEVHHVHLHMLHCSMTKTSSKKPVPPQKLYRLREGHTSNKCKVVSMFQSLGEGRAS